MMSPANALRNKLLLDGLRTQGHEDIAETLEAQIETGAVTCSFVVMDNHDGSPMTISTNLRFLPFEATVENTIGTMD